MKTALRIALAPVMLAIRLMLGLVAFITSITSSVLGLSVSLFGLLSVIEFFIGYWQNGIAFMVLAPHWIACNRHPSAEPSGSSHWFLRGPGLLKITCLRRFVCITDRRFSYLWRYVWQQPGSSRCTSIRGKP